MFNFLLHVAKTDFMSAETLYAEKKYFLHVAFYARIRSIHVNSVWTKTGSRT